MKINEIKQQFLSQLSITYPKQEIESFFYLLSQKYLGLKRIDVALNPDFKINSKTDQEFNSALAKLKQEIPIQYIIGETEFYGLPFYVDKNVLIPRPETEELVEWIVQEVKSKKLKVKSAKSLTILDIGTGSGCIAIALAKNIPFAKVWALDVSEKALKIAKKNAILNGVDLQFLNEDILALKKLHLQFDIIVSNPPYVRELEKSKMHKNVLSNEPHLALFVKNNNPLLFYNKIADLAKENLNLNGELYFEINQAFAKETKTLLKEKGFQNIESKKDIFGNDRMVKADLFQI